MSERRDVREPSVTSDLDGGNAGDGDGDGDDGYVDDLEPRGGSHLARNLAIVVGVVLLLFIGLLATRKSVDDRASVNQLVGQAMPKVTGTTIDGQPLDLDSLKGKWVVVNFFASWCVPCQIEHPELKKFVQEHEATGDAAVVSIAFGDQPAAVKAYFERNGGSWPAIVQDDGHAAIDFGLTGVPESFVVAPNQLVVAHFEGVTAAQLDTVIQTYGGGGGSGGATSGSVAPTTTAKVGGP